MGAVLRSDNFVEGAKIVVRANRNYEKSIEIEKSTRELLWDL